MKDFLFPVLRVDNIDTYVIRKGIFGFIRNNLHLLNGNLLDVGCGKMPYREFILKNSHVHNYIGLDIDDALVYDKNVKPDFFWDGKVMPFANDTFDTAIATEVLEHIFEPSVFLRETYRVLKKDGVFFFTVPFIWNLHETPNDYYRYTPYALEKYLENTGFKTIDLKPMGGWHASMAQMLGLWLRRAPMRYWQRDLLSKSLKPLISFLIKKDNKIPFAFKEKQMITGIGGIAIKR